MVIVFIHVPKTAGTSMLHAFKEQYGDKVYHYGVTAPYNKFKAHAKKLTDMKVVGGHLTLQQAEMIPGEKKIFTILRSPVERIISYYNYIRVRPHHSLYDLTEDADLELFLKRCELCGSPQVFSFSKQRKKAKFINSREVMNGICRRFCNEESADLALSVLKEKNIFVIKQEELDQQINAFKNEFGLDNFLLPKMNVSDRKDIHVSQTAIEMIERFNKEDMALYLNA